MLPEKLGFLGRWSKFENMLIEQVKQNKIDEKDFYALIRAKCKVMERERREKVEIKVEFVD